MGSLQASEFASLVDDGSVSIDLALGWHLSSNHYPPVPAAFLETCKAAIEAGQDEDWDRDCGLPRGCVEHHVLLPAGTETHEDGCTVIDAITWKDDRPMATAGDLIDSFHLDSFL